MVTSHESRQYDIKADYYGIYLTAMASVKQLLVRVFVDSFIVTIK